MGLIQTPSLWRIQNTLLQCSISTSRQFWEKYKIILNFDIFDIINSENDIFLDFFASSKPFPASLLNKNLQCSFRDQKTWISLKKSDFHQIRLCQVNWHSPSPKGSYAKNEKYIRYQPTLKMQEITSAQLFSNSPFPTIFFIDCKKSTLLGYINICKNFRLRVDQIKLKELPFTHILTVDISYPKIEKRYRRKCLFD